MLTKVLAGLFFISSALYGGAGKWEKELSEEGVKVWTRSVADSDVRQVKSVVTVKAHPDKIWEGLNTRDKFLKVMPFVIESKDDYDACGDNCKHAYQIIDRSPLKKRAYYLKVQWTREESEDGQSIVIHHKWTKVKNKPVPKKYVEVEHVYGRWAFVSKDGGKTTKFTYVSFLDMGGMVPVSMVNSSLKENAFKFAKNVKKKAPSW